MLFVNAGNDRETSAFDQPDNPDVAESPVGDTVKRLVDIIGALAALLFLAPLLGIVAVVVSLDGGPVIFRHERVGFAGRHFKCLKFRSMAPDAEARLEKILSADPVARQQWEIEQKLTPDPRVTPFGRFIRKTSIDELPQLINVLRGEMSLVGPRPITPAEAVRYGDSYGHYLKCRPGITGLWQVSGRNNLSYKERVMLDRRYVESHTHVADLKILLITCVVVFRGLGAR